MSLKYTKNHEWIELLADGSAAVGISDHAQGALGDITFVDVPKLGDRFNAGDAFAVVESVKAASDIYMPVSGKITDINAALDEDPQLINNSPTSEGWIVKIAPDNSSDIDSLLGEAEYLASI